MSAEATSAVARSKLYRVFADALEYPDAALREVFAAGDVYDALAQLLPEMSSALAARLDREALTAVPEREDLAADYSALFDVGASGKPPCPLYGGAYGGAERMKVMEEIVRFYDHFGLRLAPSLNEMPDALAAQLEFLHFLAFRQAQAEDANNALPYRHAERDFIARHPGRWVPEMRARLEKAGASVLYRHLVMLLDDFLRVAARCVDEFVNQSAQDISIKGSQS